MIGHASIPAILETVGGFILIGVIFGAIVAAMTTGTISGGNKAFISCLIACVSFAFIFVLMEIFL